VIELPLSQNWERGAGGEGFASIEGGRGTCSDARKVARVRRQNGAKSGLLSRIEGRFCEHRAGLEAYRDARRRTQ